MKRNFLIILSLFVFATPQKKKITIWLIGDSTMSVKDPKTYPETGWGMPFVQFWDSTVTVDNRAMNGRSTRTFFEEKRWDPVMQHMQEGDWVFIQFGHNDEVPSKKSYVNEADFKTNLLKYINDTRSKKANPVLLTPVARRKFDSSGKIEETHAVYAQIVRDVAKDNNVPMIDLAEKGKDLYTQYGPGASKYLLNHLATGEHPNYPDGKVDDTHFNELGARKIAQIVLAEIRKLNLELTERVIQKKSQMMTIQSLSMLNARKSLFLLLCFFASTAVAQSLTGVTGKLDTSYTNYSAYISTRRSNPETRIVEEVIPATVAVKKDIEFCAVPDAAALKLDIFYPKKNNNSRRIAVVIIHGGGWRSGNRTQHHAMAARLAEKGYVCFTPQYRLSTVALYPAAVHDVKSAIRYVRSMAKKFNVDPDRIVVAGFSAGGELAAFMGATNGLTAYEGNGCNKEASSQVQAVIDIDGTLSFVHPESGEGDDSKRISAATYWFGYSKKDNLALWTDASPLTQVGPHTPPTLFINSSVERMHAGREDYIRILKTWGTYTEVKTFDKAPHSFCLFHPWFEPTIETMDGFLKKVFK